MPGKVLTRSISWSWKFLARASSYPEPNRSMDVSSTLSVENPGLPVRIRCRLFINRTAPTKRIKLSDTCRRTSPARTCDLLPPPTTEPDSDFNEPERSSLLASSAGSNANSKVEHWQTQNAEQPTPADQREHAHIDLTCHVDRPTAPRNHQYQGVAKPVRQHQSSRSRDQSENDSFG